MELEKLSNEIVYLEKCFLYITKNKNDLKDNIKVILESSINHQENIEELKSTQNNLCNDYDQFKHVSDKSLETLSKYIDELKKVKTELESLDTKSSDLSIISSKPVLDIQSNLEHIFIVC